jgi:hypothetical protein
VHKHRLPIEFAYRLVKVKRPTIDINPIFTQQIRDRYQTNNPDLIAKRQENVKKVQRYFSSGCEGDQSLW